MKSPDIGIIRAISERYIPMTRQLKTTVIHLKVSVRDRIKQKGNQKCIILKDSEKWVVEPRKMPELYSVLKKNHIHNKKTNGMIVDVDVEWQCVELLLKSVFQYNTSVIFVLPKSQVVAIPTDHMDIFMYGIAREIQKG